MPLSTATLAELIQRRHDCLRDLLVLVRKQHELATGGDLDALLAVLGRKQPYLQSLQSISRALAPFGKEDAEERQWLDSSHRARCQDLWNASTALCDEIMAGEQSSESLLRERRDEVSRRLEMAHSSHHVHATYVQGTPLPSHAGRQLDLTEA